MKDVYGLCIKKEMKKFFNRINEKDRRHYAALEAKKLGYGGVSYISRVLGCSRDTIITGMKELNQKECDSIRIRKPGGGRKFALELIPNINQVFLDVLKDNTAGDPMKDILWTNLTQKEISEGMKKKGIEISVTVVKQLLKKHKYVKRKSQKKRL